MKIIAHRGFWAGDEKENISSCEKNSLTAFKLATEHGFGIETDFRDLNEEVVISHNPPNQNAMLASDFFKLIVPGQVIAVNVKSDGITDQLLDLWKRLAPKAVPFAFDMSIPDTIGYLKKDFPFLERQSEYEKSIVWDNSSGFWLDGFHSVWFGQEDILDLLEKGKPVFVVSRELHNQDPYPLWEMLREVMKKKAGCDVQLYLCTDRPFEAKRFFKEYV